MKRLILASASVAFSALVIGCDTESDTTPPATPAAGEMQPATPSAPSAGDRASDLMSGATGQAREAAGQAAGAAEGAVSSQLDQVATYIKENKLDLAEKALDGIEKNKSTLPQSLQPRVTQLRQMLDSAKAKQTTTPGAGGATTPQQPTTPAQ